MGEMMDLESTVRAIDLDRARSYRTLRRLMAEAVRAGQSQRKIANQTRRTQPEVNRLARRSADRGADGRPRWWATARSTRESVAAELRAGRETQAFRLTVQAWDDLRRLDALADLDEWALTPLPFSDLRFETLLAALGTREFTARGITPPAWMNTRPLKREWFVHALPSQRRRAELEGPDDLRALGIMLTENDLVTA